MSSIADTIALVLGMGPTSLALVRALGRKGVPVCGVGLNRHELALSSRYCHRLGAIDPRCHPERLLDLLLEFGNNQSHDKKLLLYPTGDECVVFIAEHHEQLAQYYSFSRLNREVMELFLNKARFYEACTKHNLLTPRTFIPQNSEDLREIAKAIAFPCIIKPKYYHRWAMKHGLSKVVYCRNSNELLRCTHTLSEDITDFIVQEVIGGPEDKIYVVAAYFDRNCVPHGLFVGQKIRQYPVGFGTTTLIRSGSADELKELSVDFLQKVGYQGLVDIEYKYDARTNSFYIIEINPRLGRWYGIVEAAGLDTMYYSYLDLTDQPIPVDSVKSRAVTWAFVSRDMLSVLKNKRWHTTNLLRSYAGPRTWCIWAKDDIKPFFGYFLEMMSKGIKVLKGRERGQSVGVHVSGVDVKRGNNNEHSV